MVAWAITDPTLRKQLLTDPRGLYEDPDDATVTDPLGDLEWNRPWAESRSRRPRRICAVW
ncbi:hypothetical protein SBI_07590 [Streptomyces bingchenggensis BCW-1]|uniref:Uncharacterized protein n=1 Tax=Streptomyces bingchenggensis (strain BCW-1) TaxID=749414 RepID=D7CB27_STRBB|nr:hypothetical protein SBI_07590 [Streptomyces bingchenggensis BCW-1]